MKKVDEENKGITYKNMIMDIKVSLAGAIAEEIIYGSENRSVGASADISNATAIASKCIRIFGFGNYMARFTYLKDPMTTKEGLFINPDNQDDINDAILQLLQDCRVEVHQLLTTKEWYDMLVASSKYLSKHAAMTQKKMKQLYNEIPDEMKCDKKERFYRDILAKL
jgi:ATP-dependent Zn protease